jgi:hypothetical protein
MTSALSVDVENEFQDLLKEAGLLAQVIVGMDAAPEPLDEPTAWIMVSGLAPGCERIYSECEGVMELIARRVHGAAVDRMDSWHAVLLNRMAHPFPGVRTAVINADCRAQLDRFRAFRHRVRNGYGMELDRDIVQTRAREFGPTLAAFHGEVSVFLTARDAGG